MALRSAIQAGYAKSEQNARGAGAKHGWVVRVVTVAQAEAYATEKPHRKRRGKTTAPGLPGGEPGG
jgi:hypothetical protein